MFISRLFSLRVVLAILATILLANAAYAFAATNTVPGSNAGDGEGAISGYTITGITYTLNGTDPRNVDTVKFTIADTPAPANVSVRFNGTGIWFTCTVAATTWTCSGLTGVTALGAVNLQVVAAQ